MRPWFENGLVQVFECVRNFIMFSSCVILTIRIIDFIVCNSEY